jgi:hypothetical protein
MQEKLIAKSLEVNRHKPYARGSWNKSDAQEQWIRISEGCPNRCEYCRESVECGIDPIYLPIPEIVRNKVKIMDMNLLYKAKAIEVLNMLGSMKVNNKVIQYELICGIDWRFMTQEKANALKQNRFVNVRFAWDHQLIHQMKIKDCLNMLLKAQYKAKDLACFVLCDWKIPYEDCLKKLDLLKICNVQVADCWYDNTQSPNFQCNYWSLEQCKDFRKKCRKHNQMIIFGIDLELRESVNGGKQ